MKGQWKWHSEIVSPNRGRERTSGKVEMSILCYTTILPDIVNCRYLLRSSHQGALAHPRGDGDPPLATVARPARETDLDGDPPGEPAAFEGARIEGDLMRNGEADLLSHHLPGPDAPAFGERQPLLMNCVAEATLILVKEADPAPGDGRLPEEVQLESQPELFPCEGALRVKDDPRIAQPPAEDLVANTQDDGKEARGFEETEEEEPGVVGGVRDQEVVSRREQRCPVPGQRDGPRSTTPRAEAVRRRRFEAAIRGGDQPGRDVSGKDPVPEEK